MQPQFSTNPVIDGPTSRGTLAALALADASLSRVADCRAPAVHRLRSRVAAHEAQLEKLSAPHVQQTQATREARHRLTLRLVELNAALAEVESYEIAGLRDLAAEGVRLIRSARVAARVDVVLADEMRRRHDDRVRVLSRDLFAAGV